MACKLANDSHQPYCSNARAPAIKGISPLSEIPSYMLLTHPGHCEVYRCLEVVTLSSLQLSSPECMWRTCTCDMHVCTIMQMFMKCGSRAGFYLRGERRWSPPPPPRVTTSFNITFVYKPATLPSDSPPRQNLISWMKPWRIVLTSLCIKEKQWLVPKCPLFRGFTIHYV